LVAIVLSLKQANLTIIRHAHAELLDNRPELCATGFVTDQGRQSPTLRAQLHNLPLEISDPACLCYSETPSPDHSGSDDHESDQ
jgi:hypothetical protein